MRPAITSNFILRPMLYWFACVALFIMGWKVKGKAPAIKKFVLIAAPHSTNWDFVFTMLAIFKLKIAAYWMAKNTMFIQPFRYLLIGLGGLPIDRSQKNDVVQQMADTFTQSDELIVTIAPSGTRGKTVKWKSGFYHIAHKAGVPIVLGFIDYAKKEIGLGPVFLPTGNIDADMKIIRDHYSKFSGKYQLES